MINKFKVDSKGKLVHSQKVNTPNTAPFQYEPTKHVKTEKPKDTPTLNGVDVSDYVPNVTKTESEKVIERMKGLGKGVTAEITYEKAQPLVPISKANLYFIQSQGYYVAYDNGKALFYSTKSGKGTQGSTLPTILRKPNEGQAGSGIHSIKASYTAPPVLNKNTSQRPQGTNLTKAEFDGIISGKPSMEALLSVYDRYSQEDINIDLAKAQPVW